MRSRSTTTPPRARMLVTAIAIALILVGVLPMEASATGNWSRAPSANPTVREGELMGLACASATACTAVGSYAGTAGTEVTLAEGWNGKNWAIEASPDPAGATASRLYAVACAKATSCTAVGTSMNSSRTNVTLAEDWNGKKWAIEASPDAAGATASRLYAVACTAPTACTAVGISTNGSGTNVTLAEDWNGKKWAIEASPDPASSEGSSLYAVSCAAVTLCTGVGMSTNSSGTDVTLAERWNGKTWLIVATPNPAGAEGSHLYAVACSSATVCTAVGDHVNDAGAGSTLGESLRANAWVIGAIPNPTAATDSYLYGVSCTARTMCISVGSYVNSAGADVTLAEQWNGKTWKVESTPDPGGAAGSYLYAVACITATNCAAVGSSVSTAGLFVALVETWNGKKWAAVPTPEPNGATAGYLNSVSCASPSACTAVGSWTNSADDSMTLAEFWNGSKWAVGPTPDPIGSTASYLYAVSCTRPRTCTAVGSSTNALGVDGTLAEDWNGSIWAVDPTPDPIGASASYLYGVSCTGAVCTAVGNYADAAGIDVTLAEDWNGIAWSVVPAASPTSAASSYLVAVSCTSMAACSAVGDYADAAGAYVPLAESWNGTTWTIVPASTPVRSSVSYLNGVSCLPTASCTAVGYSYEGADIAVTLIEGST